MENKEIGKRIVELCKEVLDKRYAKWEECAYILKINGCEVCGCHDFIINILADGKAAFVCTKCEFEYYLDDVRQIYDI